MAPQSARQKPAPAAADAGKSYERALFDWLCRMGDNCLILGHRVSQWCGHGPILEEDIALANTALDLIGHTQMWLTLAGEVEGAGRTADNLAYLRDAHQIRNLQLVELPGGDIGHSLMRQFLFDAWHFEMLQGLVGSGDARVAEIASKALREVSYHLERSSDLVVRLGDGSEESHSRMQSALERLWPYAGEMLAADEVDLAMAAAGVAPALQALRTPWQEAVEEVFSEATLTLPPGRFDVHQGGKTGRHTEHLGYILAEMQFLQRAYPGAQW